jgi:hypothetical protein
MKAAGRGFGGCSLTWPSKARKLKWAASQEAVTFPWLSAHSILKRIGGDTYMVDPQIRLSRTKFLRLKLALEATSHY